MHRFLLLSPAGHGPAWLLAVALAWPAAAAAHDAAARRAQAAPPAMPSTAVHGDTSALDSSGDYRQEVQACREGRTGEDRATCLREARHAQADRRRGALTTQGDLQANALARCNAHREAVDQDACRERVLGATGLSGSVAGGGLLREYVVTLPPEPAATLGGPAAPAAPAAPPESVEQAPMPQEPDATMEAPAPESPDAPAQTQE